MAKIVKIDSTPPAAPRRCPVAPYNRKVSELQLMRGGIAATLVEDTANLYACCPNTRLIALLSISSPRGVDVACALTYCTLSGVRPVMCHLVRPNILKL